MATLRGRWQSKWRRHRCWRRQSSALPIWAQYPTQILYCTLRFWGQRRSTNSRVGKDEGMLGAFSSWHWRNANADNAAWLCPKPFLSKAVAHVRPSSTCWIASYTTGRNWAIVSLPSAVAARRLWYLARKRSLYCKNACVSSGWRSQVSPAGTTMGQMPWAAQH